MNRRNIAYTLLGFALASSGCGKVENYEVEAAVNGGAETPAEETNRDCPIGTTVQCEENELVTCDESGSETGRDACALGCNAEEARCNDLDPSNGLAPFLDDAAAGPDLVLSGTAIVDTDAGTIIDQSGPVAAPTATRADGLPVGLLIVHVGSLTAEDITVTGSRALAIVANGDITLSGVLDVSARRDDNGPGAIANDPGCRGRNGGTTADGKSGGGGGGFGSAGGGGGTAGVMPGGAAGSVTGTIELAPLRGGCPGGHPGGAGPDENPIISDPGGGGGAVQLVSRTSITITPTGFISANGGGGKGNTSGGLIFCIVDTPCGDGEGGGSGGGVLLEAPVVNIAEGGGVAANGGAGSCLLSGAAASGQNSDQPAVGQTCGNDTGDGGNGGAGTSRPENGGNGLNDDPVGGGGGGGTGRIRVNVALGENFTPAGVVSPPASVGVLTLR